MSASPRPWRTFNDPLRLQNPEAIASLLRTVINCPSSLRARQGESLDHYHIGDRIRVGAPARRNTMPAAHQREPGEAA